MAIRYTYQDRRKLQKAISNYNRRITIELKKNPSLKSVYPKKLTYEEVRPKISSRADYNRTINSLKRISKKGAFDVITSGAGEAKTRYEVNEARVLTNATNTRIRNYMKKLNTKSKVQMADTNLSIRRFSFKGKEIDAFDRFVKGVEKQLYRVQNPNVMDENYYYQYLNALKYQLNMGNGDELYDFVANLPPSAISMARFENDYLTIASVYDPNDEGEVIQAIYENWADWWNRNKDRFV